MESNCVYNCQQRYNNINATLTDIKGAVIKNAVTSDGLLQINTTDMAEGMYLLQVTADGRETSYQVHITN